MATLHINDRRHFPLSFVAVRAIKVIVAAYLMCPDHERLVYGNCIEGQALDALAIELREDQDEDSTPGSRRYSALLFAMAVAPMYWEPRELGFFMPMR